MSTPTLNVNLKPCGCAKWQDPVFPLHQLGCAATPVLIPLSLEPFRSVTFEVRLGECNCPASPGYAQGSKGYPYPRSFGPDRGHALDCPARPVRVSCSISGKTWAESEVGTVDWQTRNERGDWCPSPMSPADYDMASALCRERWALVKALVLGHTDLSGILTGPKALELLSQRDAVYAALADMARAEEQAWQAAKRLLGAIPRVMVSDAMRVPKPSDPECTTASESWLAAYGERLIEQVGAL